MDIRSQFKTGARAGQTVAYSLLAFYIEECRKHVDQRLYWFDMQTSDPRFADFASLIPLCEQFGVDPRAYLQAQVDQAVYEKKDFVPPHCLCKGWGIDRFAKACRRVHDEAATTTDFSQYETMAEHIRNMHAFKGFLKAASGNLYSMTDDQMWKKMFSSRSDHLEVMKSRIPVSFKDLSVSYRDWHLAENGSVYIPSGNKYSQDVIDAFQELFLDDIIEDWASLLIE